jgi:hypothetical protein
MLNGWLFMSRVDFFQPSRFVRMSLSMGLAAMAVGCAQTSAVVAKPERAASPIAEDLTMAAHANLAYPKFADIPLAPKDVRPAGDWRKAVVLILRDKSVIETIAEANPASLFDAEGFAKSARARAAVKPSDVTPAMSREESEAFAKALRDRATAPPPQQ